MRLICEVVCPPLLGSIYYIYNKYVNTKPFTCSHKLLFSRKRLVEYFFLTTVRSIHASSHNWKYWSQHQCSATTEITLLAPIRSYDVIINPDKSQHFFIINMQLNYMQFILYNFYLNIKVMYV